VCTTSLARGEGMSPLHLAARTNDAAMVLLLAAASCKVDGGLPPVFASAGWICPRC